MNDLTEFLLARIAEDKAVAQEAIRHTRDGETDHWQYDGEDVSDSRYGSAIAVGPWGGGLSGEGPHIARWDPARVLAECEVKRRIVETYRTAERSRAHQIQDELVSGQRYGLLLALRLLALPYADHPDYREEWRP